MTDRPDPTRRMLLASTLSLTALGAAAPALAAAVPTPAQTRGPFYPVRYPLDSDNDLVRVKGSAAQALGQVTHLAGRVLDTSGRQLAGARVEIWQCDAKGVYHHPGDRGARDANFQGYGRVTSARDGGYRFRTIKPVPYPGRTPHIHFAVKAPGLRELVTQMYIDEHPLNERDWLYRRAAAQGGTITAPFRPAPEIERGAMRAHFNIVLG